MPAVRSWTRRAASKLKNLSGYDICLIAISIAVLVLSWVRLYFGVETLDEAYAMSQGRLIVAGNVPFADIWSAAGTSALTFWIEPLYRLFSSSLEGYYLFFRQVSFLIKLGMLTACYYLLRKRLPQRPLILFLALFLPLGPHGIYAMNYNMLSLLFLLLACSMLIKSCLEEKRSLFWSLLSGVMMALGCLAHSSLVLTAVLTSLLLLCFGAKPIRLKRMGAYILGGVSSAIVIFLTLIILAGGFEEFFYGFIKIMQSPYSLLFAGNLLNDLWVELEVIFSQGQAVFFMLTAALICAALFTRPDKTIPDNQFVSFRSVRRNMHIALLLLSILYILIAFVLGLRGKNLWDLHFYSLGSFAYMPVILYFFTESDKAINKALILLLWLPAFLFIVAVAAMSTGAFNHWFMIFPCTAITAYFYDETAAYAFSGPKEQPSRKPAPLQLLRIACSAALALFVLTGSYGYVFRDRPISSLKSKVQSGVFKGVYTSEAAAQHYPLLENEIRAHTSAGEKVLFLELAPYAYLMTEATPFAPSTWDVMQTSFRREILAAGYSPDDYLLSYYVARNEYPDKLIYIPLRDTPFTLEEHTTLLTNFVNTNYRLSYMNENLKSVYATMTYDCPIYVYERTDAPIMLPAYTEEIEPLPVSAMKYEMTLLEPNPSFTVKPQEQIFVDILLKNTGDAIWPMGPPYSSDSPDNILHVGAHVYKDGELQFETRNGRLYYDLYPGRSAKLRLELWSPAEPGIYTLAFDVVQEYVDWFEGINQNQPLVLQLEVVE